MLYEFQSHIIARQLFQKNDRLIVAVSGGADSVALCLLCHLSGYQFEMAHCNFQLRGAESDRDERFVRALASSLDVVLHVERFGTERYAAEQKVNTQIAARELRYRWFDTLIAKENGPSFLLTAHHADDNIETLLMHFFKGTGMRGLQGIPEKNGYIVRPLLYATRREILAFLQDRNQDFVEDSSNLSDDYTRNWLRNKLIPSLRGTFPAVEENLMHNLERFREIGLLYDQAVEQHIKKLVEKQGHEVLIPVLKLRKLKPVKSILYEIVREFGFVAAQLDVILHLLESESGKYVSSPTHRIIRNRAWLIITPVRSGVSHHILIDEHTHRVEFEAGVLEINKTAWYPGSPVDTDPRVALLDARLVTFPLMLRPWKTGDYFYPLGMNKKKKLSRFFIDQKMSVTEKESAWVVTSGQHILWIVGFRIDNRFKLTDRTQEALVLKCMR